MDENKETEKFTISEIQNYYTETQKKFSEINDDINYLKENKNNLNETEKKIKIEELLNKIKNYREQFYNVMEFLPSHDKLTYSKNYDDYIEKVNNIKKDFFPKKKFSFSNKNKKNEAKTHKENNENNLNNNNNNIVDNILKNDNTDFIIKDLSNDLNKKISSQETLNKNNLIIENINNSTIYILQNFKACYIKNITNSNIFIGSVAGGTHITSSKDSNIYLITHQLRIHETFNTKFYVLINSNPIIEKSKELIFYPLKIKYNDYNENVKISGVDVNKNNWNNVQDFQWLKKEKSPNFDVKDDNELIEL